MVYMDIWFLVHTVKHFQRDSTYTPTSSSGVPVALYACQHLILSVLLILALVNIYALKVPKPEPPDPVPFLELQALICYSLLSAIIWVPFTCLLDPRSLAEDFTSFWPFAAFLCTLTLLKSPKAKCLMQFFSCFPHHSHFEDPNSAMFPRLESLLFPLPPPLLPFSLLIS